MTLNEYIEAFVVHVTFLLMMAIHQVKKAQITLLITKKVKIPIKYLDFSNIFFKEKAFLLPKTIKSNKCYLALKKLITPF